LPEPPHRFPFRLVEPGIAQVTPSLGASLPRQEHAPDYPLALALEAMAQAVIAAPPPGLERGDAAPGIVHLAGIEQGRLLAAIAPGDRLEAHAELLGRFGPAAKVRCRLERDGTKVAEATLLLTFTG